MPLGVGSLMLGSDYLIFDIIGKNDDIKSLIDKNKAKAYQEQQEMRDDIAFYVFNCDAYRLQKMYQKMKELKNEKDNSER